MTAPNAVALAGPNGAGKSTVGPALLRHGLGISTFVNADVIAQGLSGFDPEGAALTAGRIMLEYLDDLTARRESFAFETTLAGRAYARRMRRLLDLGYDFHVVFLWLDSPDLAVARVKERVRAGGHDIPEDVIRRRYREGLRNFRQMYLPMTTSWRLYDNSSGPPPRLIAAGRGNETRDIIHPGTWSRITSAAG